MSLFNSFTYKRTAVDGHEFDLSCQVVGTHDFGVPYRPVFCREVVPGDQWSIKLSTFTRLSAMVLPTFGKVKLVNRFFYVPMTCIHDAWNEFLEGRSVSTVNSSGTMFTRATPSVITISNSVLTGALTNIHSEGDEDHRAFCDSCTESEADFKMYEPNLQRDVYFKFNVAGKQIVNMLLGLGYVPSFRTADDSIFSAMPLIAYAKVCYDWLIDANFVNVIDFEVQSLFRKINGVISVDECIVLFNFFSTCYEKDYFTSAWQSPNQVSSSSYSNPFTSSMNGWNFANLSGSGSPSPSNTVNNGSAGTYTKIDPSSGSFYLSKFGLDVLDALSSFVKKRLFTGFRLDKQMEVDFGLKMDQELYRRSSYLGSVVCDVQISDVMSTAQTENSGVKTYLGEFAGKGIGYEDGFIKFDNSRPEFGILLCFSAVVPDSSIVQGRSRELFHIKREDFFNGAFEAVGPQTIRNDELFVEGTNMDNISVHPKSIFGYSPRFSEYKCGASGNKLLGDFRFRHINGSGAMDAFHLFRLFNSEPINTYSFKTTADSNQFKRIFSIPNDDFEHFNVIWNFDIKVFRKMLPINDLVNEVGYGSKEQMNHADDFLHG